MAMKYSSKFAMVIMYQHNYVHFQLQSSQLKKRNYTPGQLPVADINMCYTE